MPERIAVFDCFSGIAGDMTLAALIDAGADLEAVRDGLSRLGLPAFAIETEAVTRGGMRARYLRVTVPGERRYEPGQMREMVRAAALPDRVTARAIAAIDALAEGEARAHAVAEAHFHEVGGVDALIDIVGGMLAFESLEIARGFCPVVTVGAATITRSEHGPLPAAPGPAAAHILQVAGFAMRFVEASHELVTPTGAAILAAVATPGAVVITASAHGAGAGTMDPPGRPNALRIFVGEAAPAGLPGVELGEVVLLEANIDDMTPALVSHARDQLLAAGALDAWTEAIGMKKGRPALKLCALARPAAEEGIAAAFLRETTTLGVRVAPYRRYEAPRAIETFGSTLGPVSVKRSSGRATLEFEDVKALAMTLGRPIIDVQRQLETELALHSFDG